MVRQTQAQVKKTSPHDGDQGFSLAEFFERLMKSMEGNRMTVLGLIVLLLGLIQLREIILGMMLVVLGILLISGFFKDPDKS